MEKIIDRIYVGGDEDVDKAKERHYSRLAACKDGPDGHRAMFGYDTLGAPKGKHYLFGSTPGWGAINLIDHENVEFIPTEAVLDGLKWAKKEYDAGRTILFHCNHGQSRGPTMALMFLRAIGEMPAGFTQALKIFRTLYSPFDPQTGMKQKAHELWKELPTLFKGQ